MIETDETLYYRFLAERKEDDFRILLERHKEGLMLFLYSFVHNMEDAEELMLDAYAEIAVGARFSERSSFKTWLFAIGKRLALMRLRKNRFSRHRQTQQTDAPDTPMELNLFSEERNRQLYEALRRLKPEYRQVLILLYFEDMSHEEAGRVMGKNRKQMYNLADRSKLALKAELERMGFDYAQY